MDTMSRQDLPRSAAQLAKRHNGGVSGETWVMVAILAGLFGVAMTLAYLLRLVHE